VEERASAAKTASPTSFPTFSLDASSVDRGLPVIQKAQVRFGFMVEGGLMVPKDD
jgi:hypothetical protein